MSVRHYGPLVGLAASVSLLPGLLSGCGANRPAAVTDTVAAAPTQPVVRMAEADNTDETLWTVLGLAKRRSRVDDGPQTGTTVSPDLWQAAHDTLGFAGIDSEDPVTGLVQTKWYFPSGKTDERLRISAFILSRALRSDSLALTIERQVRTANGGWEKTPIARDVVDNLDNDILLRARQIHAERYRKRLEGNAG